MKKLIRLVSLSLIISLLFCGCELLDKAKEFGGLMDQAMEANENPGGTKTYSNGGVSFELPNNFLDFTNTETGGDYPFLYANENIGLFGVQESKAEFEEIFGSTDLTDRGSLRTGCHRYRKRGLRHHVLYHRRRRPPNLPVCVL